MEKFIDIKESKSDDSFDMIKSLSKRGNTYYFKENIKNETDILSLENTEKMFDDLYNDCKKNGSDSSTKALVMKKFNIFLNIVIIIFGIVVSFLSLNGPNLNIKNYIAACFGFLISGIKTFLSIYCLEKRSIVLKDLSFKFNVLCRNINSLRNKEEKSIRYKIKYLEKLYEKVDELEMIKFDYSIVSISNRKSKNMLDRRTTRTLEHKIDIDKNQ
jgi:hypothetical protein